MTTEHAGSGDGSGSGSGDGSGSGYGDGSGSGSGDGSGYGDGSGSGYGSGSGSGDGDGDYWQRTIAWFASKWDVARQARLSELSITGAKIAFWRSDGNGQPANGGRMAPVKPGDVQTIKGPLELCTARALHATLIPPKWKGERWWIVALIGEVKGDDEKMGALTREIIGECL